MAQAYQSPIPTPYPTNPAEANPYVPVGTVSYPVSTNAIPVQSLLSGGTGWLNNTYGYSSTPYTIPSSQVQVVSARQTQSQNQPSGQVLPLNTEVPSGPSQEDILNQGYNDYLSQLDQMLGTLGNQSTSLQGAAQENFNQNLNTLNLQNTQGQETLNTYQGKTLKDIGNTIGAGFRAGNVLLGAMGAGDSSAANQYAYALAKEGSKQRGNVMSDVSTRLGQLQQVYNTAKQNLTSSLQQKINEISTWFSQQQMTLQGMKADAARERSSQLLQIATNALGVAQQQASGMQNALNTWVANNATSIQQAQSQMQTNVANNPIPVAMNTTPQSAIASTAPKFFSNTSTTEKQNSLFPNYNYLG